MIAALTLMCAIHSRACHTDDARAIARAIDAATEDDGLRAHLSVYSWHESRFQRHPRAESWDAVAGRARGAWQLWQGGDADLLTQARQWLYLVQRGGLAALDSSPRRAARRAREAERLLATIRSSASLQQE